MLLKFAPKHSVTAAWSLVASVTQSVSKVRTPVVGSRELLSFGTAEGSEHTNLEKVVLSTQSPRLQEEVSGVKV